MPPDRDDVFGSAGCSGWALVRCLDDGREVGLRPDEPVVLASTVKVLVAVEAEAAFVDGRLDPIRQVRVTARERVPGPVGLSLFADEASVSLRDLVVLMLTLSDNTATDLLISSVGLRAIRQRALSLGMDATVVESDLRGQLDSIAADLGYPDWSTLSTLASTFTQQQGDALDGALPAVTALTPHRATRSTARDMVALLGSVWNDTAAPPAACERVRSLMGQQLYRQRLASGFPPSVTVAAKSGGLLGVVRNEVGVITFPDGASYAAAVFTRSSPGSDPRPVDSAIGTWARNAVDSLRSER